MTLGLAYSNGKRIYAAVDDGLHFPDERVTLPGGRARKLISLTPLPICILQSGNLALAQDIVDAVATAATPADCAEALKSVRPERKPGVVHMIVCGLGTGDTPEAHAVICSADGPLRCEKTDISRVLPLGSPGGDVSAETYAQQAHARIESGMPPIEALEQAIQEAESKDGSAVRLPAVTRVI